MSDAIIALARRCAARGLRFRESRALLDMLVIVDALAAEDGNRSRAAERLGIERKHLNTRIQPYGKETEDA